ncbi:hypothetical protein BDZ97DRAFT_1790787 [Flammula alnicola]|nr:hypothetical protein BDZ97DRAFT_1790787 [Flammula alnicola]
MRPKFDTASLARPTTPEYRPAQNTSTETHSHSRLKRQRSDPPELQQSRNVAMGPELSTEMTFVHTDVGAYRPARNTSTVVQERHQLANYSYASLQAAFAALQERCNYLERELYFERVVQADIGCRLDSLVNLLSSRPESSTFRGLHRLQG